MKKATLSSLLALGCLTAQAQGFASTMADVFRAMPDSLLPSLTKNNRLDLIDFREAKMMAAVTDRLDTQATLDTLTDRFLHLTMDKTVRVDMRLLPCHTALPDTADCLVLVVTGFGEPAVESKASLYTSKWHAVELPPIVNEQVKGRLLSRPDTMPEQEYADIVATKADMMVSMEVSPSDDTLLLKPHFPLLSSDEKKRKEAVAHPILLSWDGKMFK